ncbi:MAG: reductive dehalogenase, partial [Bacteroidales bacterium]|nr:reductive dehalogenase [Candidatus Latescibacterota bacterium]
YMVDIPHYEKVSATRRVDARSEVVFSRISRLMRGWNPAEGVDGLEEPLRKYYRENPESLTDDLKLRDEIFPKRRKDVAEYHDEFVLAEAWSHAMGSVWPDFEESPPEVADFPKGDAFGEPSTPFRMRSPELTSKLVKQMSYEFGSILTGITRLKSDWVYKYPMRGRGIEEDKPFDVPKHWKYAIVVGTPMSWDPFYANPNYGSSHDSYAKSRIVAFRLVSFIKQLGYAARAHTPGMDYDLMVPPILIDAGLGEQGRHGVVVTPELGSNFRPAVITTDLPMEVDRPIEFGVQDFCRTCKICAEQCPSGAITFGDKEVVRGYRRYRIDVSKCHNFWYSNLGNIGCRLCVAVCPYSRKSNWLHRSALKVTSADPTGLSHRMLTGMQKKLYPAPDAKEYFMPSMGGSNESYRDPPWWLRTGDFIDFQEGKKK